MIESLTELSGKEIRSLIKGKEIVLLLGSGISIWHPTNLPTGIDLISSIYRALFLDECGRSVIPNEKVFNSIYNEIPFEVIMDKCPNENSLRRLLTIIFENAQPNPLHIQLAKLLNENLIQSIITTNYDCALDQAIANLYGTSVSSDMGEVTRIITEDDMNFGIKSSRKILFKIHGSIDDGDGSTLVYRLGQEGILSTLKRRIFQSLIRERTLLVIGFSGRDFEICPEIPLAQPSNIIWNYLRKEDITVNAHKVATDLEKSKGKDKTKFIIGDMRELLSLIFFNVDAKLGVYQLDLANRFKYSVSPAERFLWRARVLNSVNYNIASLTETTRLLSKKIIDPTYEIALLSEHAGALASYGSYKSAAKFHEKAAAVAKVNGFLNEAYRQLLFASDAWRCYGGYIMSISRHRLVEKAVKQYPYNSTSLQAGIARNKVLLLRDLYRLSRLLKLKPISRVIQNKASELIKFASMIYLEEGEMYSFQQLQLWCDRFNLPNDLIRSTSVIELLPPREGYQHLNFRMGSMMKFRDMVEANELITNNENLSQILQLIDEAKELGIHPEVWKFNLLLMRKYKSHRSRDVFNEFIKYFLKCEYSLHIRFWQIITGG